MQIFRVRTGLVAAATCASLAVAGLPGVPVAVAAPAAAASAADYWDKHDSASVDLKANQSIDDVALGSTITFDVAAPESAPEGGSLSLFVDGQQVDELPATTLQAEYTFNSFGPHIVLARFTDTAGANPVRDAVLTVNVVGPQTRTNSKSPLTATVVGTVNDATSSLESPVEVAPGDTVTYEVSSTVAEKVRRVETGIEPPVEEPPAEQPPSDWFSDFIANPAKLSLAAIIIGIANLLGIGAILATLWGNGMFATFGANGSSGAGVPFWGPHGRN